jgi:hypothetical protein
VQCLLNNLHEEISKQYLETTEKIEEQKFVMIDTVESLNTSVEEMIIRINDQMEMISEGSKMVWQENSNQLANAEAKIDYIITEVQNMTEKNNSNKCEKNQQLDEVLQILQNFVNGNKEIIEQGKLLFLNIHDDMSNRIDRKNYMLSSNQAFREQINSDYSDMKREILTHRKDTLKAIEGNQRLLVEENISFLKEMEQMVN